MSLSMCAVILIIVFIFLSVTLVNNSFLMTVMSCWPNALCWSVLSKWSCCRYHRYSVIIITVHIQILVVHLWLISFAVYSWRHRKDCISHKYSWNIVWGGNDSFAEGMTIPVFKQSMSCILSKAFGVIPSKTCLNGYWPLVWYSCI